MTDRTQEVLEKVAQAKEDIFEAWADIVETEAKGLVPVDTGRLRNSISHITDDDSVTIGTAVDYAPKVEFDENVRHRVGQAHWLRDGVLRTNDQRREIAEDFLKAVR